MSNLSLLTLIHIRDKTKDVELKEKVSLEIKRRKKMILVFENMKKLKVKGDLSDY